jgi:hypothetical protein
MGRRNIYLYIASFLPGLYFVLTYINGDERALLAHARCVRAFLPAASFARACATCSSCFCRVTAWFFAVLPSLLASLLLLVMRYRARRCGKTAASAERVDSSLPRTALLMAFRAYST